MARIYAAADGTVIRHDRALAELLRPAPSGVAFALDYDAEQTEAPLALNYLDPGHCDPAELRYDGATLSWRGIPIAVVPLGAAQVAEERALVNGLVAFLTGTDLTLTQLNRAVRLLYRRELRRR